VYEVGIDEIVEAQLADLPPGLTAAYLEVRAMLEVTPWSGDSMKASNPRDNVCSVPLGSAGEGAVICLIQENERLVKVLEVVWLD
jgi:hypothetical protein